MHSRAICKASGIRTFALIFQTGDTVIDTLAHVVVGKRDGSAHGGHLIEAHVRPTLEDILTESSAHLRRKTDPASGLALISL